VPLTSIRSFSEILLRHEDAEPQVQREFLDIIRKESERLTGMIDELLDVRRIGAGADELVHEDLDLRDVLGETIPALEGLAQERGVQFEGVWDRDARIVRGDRERLHRMLVNLLSNAVNFSAEGGSVEVLLRDGRQPRATLLGIRDHGPGISEEDHEIVFERFHRASAGPDQAPGTGLGLSICREIAAAHGASLWPESRGGGTTLWVEFPPPDEMQPAVDGEVVPSAGIAHAH
jgi:signal transduction histidine kinase